jgi:hypothetical protein
MSLLYLAFALYSVSFAAAWTTYVVPYSAGGDDTPALTAAFSSQPNLAKDATILFQEGVTYNILTPIKFPQLENVVISVQGNLSYAADISKTQGENPQDKGYIVDCPDAQPVRPATVGSSVGRATLLRFTCVKWPTSHRATQGLGSFSPFLLNSDLTSTGLRFTFTGGSNVTLQGSQQPNWGWVDSNGQQVGRKHIRRLSLNAYLDLSVVGCDEREPIAAKSSPWVEFPGDYKWANYVYEAVASECRRALSFTTRSLNLCLLARRLEL